MPELCTLLWSVAHSKVDNTQLQEDAVQLLEARFTANDGKELRELPLRSLIEGEGSVWIRAKGWVGAVGLFSGV